MVATADIDEGEVLFEIPRDILIAPQNSQIAEILHNEAGSIASESGWVPLLLTLMYEVVSPCSRWRPYLDLLPDDSQIDLPMFWTREERERELTGTGVNEVVDRDIANIEMEYNTIVKPFMDRHPQEFSPELCNLTLYKKMVAFIMAYSFTEPAAAADDSDDEDKDDHVPAKSPPMMVPMADILNHIADNNAHLDFGQDSLKMVATRPIQTGDEVYNTYGELSNHHLLHMYGFTEPYPNNHYDVVEIPMEHMRSAILANTEDYASLSKRFSKLDKMGFMEEVGSHVILEKEGIMNDHLIVTLLKLLHMDKADYEMQVLQMEEEDWEEENEEEEGLMTFENLPHMKKEWRDTLKTMATKQLDGYHRNIHENPASNDLPRRQLYSSQLRQGQFTLLLQLVKSCTDSD